MPEALAAHTSGIDKLSCGGIIQPGGTYYDFAVNTACYQDFSTGQQDRAAVAAGGAAKAGARHFGESPQSGVKQFRAGQEIVTAEQEIRTTTPHAADDQNSALIQ